VIAELRLLLDALCEESITAEQLARLEELVLAHPEAEAYYVRFMSFFADLSRAVAVAPVPIPTAPASPAAQRPRRSRRRRALSWGVGALAALTAALLLAVGLWPRPPEPIASHLPPPTTEPIDETVAVVLQTHLAEWEEAGQPTRPGAPLRPGRLVLKSGSAQIEFYSGATVVLQGPAEFRLVSRTEAYCARGKLRATVPPQAQGFTMGCPGANLVDRGTEFGLDVGRAKTEVHVFRGRVELYDPSANPPAAPRKELQGDEGVSLDASGEMHPIHARSGEFLTAEKLSARVAEETRVRQEEWSAASTALRRDPSLLVYYVFQTDDPSARTLPDVSRGRTNPHDGAVVGCGWGTGRWRGKPGLEFKRVSDRVRLHVPGEFASLALAAWVRPDALPNTNNSLMMADGWDPGKPHWQIGSDGTLILGVQSPLELQTNPNLRGAHYHAAGVITPDRFGRWVHLAVVYDRDAGRVTHYVDGRPAASESVWFDAPLRIGDAEIGNWNPAGYRNRGPIRNFNGCIDEFCLFARALTGDEIGRLYAVGRPVW
jgi:hypothetical protein